MIRLNRQGCNRLVLLTRRFAFKIPNVRRWDKALWGLIDNMAERRQHRAGYEGVCPLVFSVPGGFLNVMPRCRIMTDEEFAAFDSVAFRNRGAYWLSAEDKPDSFGWLSAEDKPDSFGWLNGSVVAVDYGN